MAVSLQCWTVFKLLCLTSIVHLDWCLDVDCKGRLTVDPGPVVEMGSSLSVLCQTDECSASSESPFSIKLNSQQLHPVEQTCSTARLHIPNITDFESTLVCLVGDGVVCGLDLQSGYRPAKATQFNCFTSMRSATINCSWVKGREPHLPTNYSVAFTGVNGTQLFTCQHPNCSSVIIPRTNFSEGAKYDVHVIAQNALGITTSDVFTFSVRDAVIPNAPSIREVSFTHINGSRFLMTWCSFGSSELVRHRVRLEQKLIWEGDVTQRNGSGGSVMVDGLKPRTTYQIESKVCTQAPRPKCSLWSEPEGADTPGIAPAQKPDAWRVCHSEKNGAQNVTVFWKTMESRDFDAKYYEVSYWQQGQRRHKTCPANASEVQLELPAEVKELNLTLVTSAGRSPPASLSLTHTNIAAPVVRFKPLKEDTVSLSWLWQMKPEVTRSLLAYVIQWQCSPSQVQWERLPRDCNLTYNIRGLKPGCRYNVLLYAESTRGLSKHAFLQLYSKERMPLSGPEAFIENADSKHILVRWEEPTLEHQRGFITNYTIYIRKHGTGKFNAMFKVAASERKKQINTLDPGFDLTISAWNSAGEGPRGKPVTYLQPKEKNISDLDGVFPGIWLLAAVPLVLIANLMCLNCARKRIRAMCLTYGPAWLFEKFPKVGNSNAIKLLKDDRCGSDSLWMSVCSDNDPHISPVEDISEPSAHMFLLPSTHNKEGQEARAAKPEIVDPYKPQWADTVSSTLLPETPEMEPEDYTEPERPLWACLSQPSSGKDIGLWGVTIGGFKGLGVTRDLPCSSLLVPMETECYTNENGGMEEEDGSSLASLSKRKAVLLNDMLTKGQTMSPNELLNTLKGEILDSLQINPYSL